FPSGVAKRKNAMRTLPSLAVLLELTVLHHTAYNQVHADKTFRWHGVAQGSNEAASSAKEVGIGSKDCPLDVEVLWTAEVESPVYSTPLIYPFTPNGHKQVVFATLRHALEMLEADGSVPWQWPVEFDGTVFHASPVVYDIDEDGLQDLCVASTDGNVHWISLGEYPRYMETYHLKLPPRRVQGILDPDSNTSPNLSSEQEGGVAAPRKRMLLGLGLGLELEGNEDNEEVEEEEKGEKEGEEKEGLSRGIWDAVGNDSPQHGTHGTTHGTHRNGSPDPYVSASVSGFDADVNNYGDNYGDNFGDMYGSGYYPYPFPGGDDLMMAGYWEADISVDAHILAAPVFADVNGDQVAEMIIPVSYFYDTHSIVLAGLSCWDYKHQQWLWTANLGEVRYNGVVQGVNIYASPTVADLEGDGKLEVIIGTSLGEVHILDAHTGHPRRVIRQKYGEIQSQVAVADVYGDDQLEMFVGDMDGNLACLSAQGEELWRRKLSGAISNTPMLGDIDGDGSLDVVVGVGVTILDREGQDEQQGQEGHVHAVSGGFGLDLPFFPVRLHNKGGLSAPALLVNLHEWTAGLGGALDYTNLPSRAFGRVTLGGKGSGLHLVLPSRDGHIFVIEGSTGCVNKIDVGEQVLAMVVADDLLGDGTLDLVVGTITGEV
ncbi:unnamed protein product, partial [Discosporangium mesarthrocarpum]